MQGTRKKPAYCKVAEYQPAVMESVLNLFSASSVAFWVKTTAVLVWNMEKAMTAQKTHGSYRTFLGSNLLDFSVSFSPVAGSVTLLNFLCATLLKR